MNYDFWEIKATVMLLSHLNETQLWYELQEFGSAVWQWVEGGVQRDALQLIKVAEMSAFALGLKRFTRRFSQRLWADDVTVCQPLCLWWEKTASRERIWPLHEKYCKKRGNILRIFNGNQFKM